MTRIHSLMFALLGLISLIALNPKAIAQEDAKDNWANFRGPSFNGTSETAKPPSEWSEDKNIKWKIDLPGTDAAPLEDHIIQ